MGKTVFTYGQRGGYLFECPSQRRSAKLPPKLLDIYRDGKVADTYSLVLGMDESFVVSYKGKDGQQHLQSANIPEALREWLFAKDSSGVPIRELDELRIALGPYNESFFAHDGKSFKWMGLPDGLDKSVESLRIKSGGFTDAPRVVCLGAGNSYIMTTAGGGGSWSLPKYHSLQHCVDAIKDRDEQFNLLENIALNPYRNDNWVLQSPNGVTLFYNNAQHVADGAAQITEAIKADVEREAKAKAEAIQRLALETQQAELQATLRQLDAVQQVRAQQIQLQQLQQQAALLQLQRQAQMQNTMNAINFATILGAFAGLNF